LSLYDAAPLPSPLEDGTRRSPPSWYPEAPTWTAGMYDRARPKHRESGSLPDRIPSRKSAARIPTTVTSRTHAALCDIRADERGGGGTHRDTSQWVGTARGAPLSHTDQQQQPKRKRRTRTHGHEPPAKSPPSSRMHHPPLSSSLNMSIPEERMAHGNPRLGKGGKPVDARVIVGFTQWTNVGHTQTWLEKENVRCMSAQLVF
jgi:hypothetical protein